MNRLPRAAVLRTAALFSLLVRFYLPVILVILPRPGSAAVLSDWETLLWPLSAPPSQSPMERWLNLPDSLAGWGSVNLAYYPLYYRWQDSAEESRVCNFAPSFSSLWRYERNAWLGGMALSAGKYSLLAELPTVPPHETEIAWETYRGDVSGFFGRRLPFFAESHWIVAGGWGEVHHVGNPWWAGAALVPYPNWIFTYEHRRDLQYLQLDYSYEDENIVLPFSFRTVGDRGAVSGKISSLATFKAELASYALLSLWEDPAELERVFSPQGGFRTQKYQLELHSRKYGSFLLAHRQNYLKSQGYFYDEGQSFGKMTRCDLFLSLFDVGWKNPGMKRSRISLLYRYLTIQGYLRGRLEFWPFTPTLIDLLGQWRRYEGQMEAELHGFQGSWDHPVVDPLRAKIGLALWYIEPSAEFSHYRTVLFGMGKADERVTVLDILEAWMGGVTLGLDYDYSRWKVSLLARQLFPIRVLKREVPEIAPPEPAEPAPEAKAYGGGFFNVSITYYIPKMN